MVQPRHLAIAALLQGALLLFPALGAAEGTPGAPKPLEVVARLSQLPTTPRCRDRRPFWAATRYIVESRRAKGLRRGSEIVVLHACPRLPRGHARRARGDAGTLRPGDRHTLQLAPWVGPQPKQLSDPRPDDGLPRFRALETNQAEKPPTIVVTVEGGAGLAQKITFHRNQVTVGSRIDSDVLLTEGDVAARHLRFRRHKDTLVVLPVKGATVRIDGKEVPSTGQPITYQSTITCGLYSLSASLLMANETPTKPERRRRR